ncbi:MAG: hypothetical protein VX228_16605 [Pseudomonadota bacterium]|nr:hypothetical protein [Pseudomonadota bacterium]
MLEIDPQGGAPACARRQARLFPRVCREMAAEGTNATVRRELRRLALEHCGPACAAYASALRQAVPRHARGAEDAEAEAAALEASAAKAAALAAADEKHREAFQKALAEREAAEAELRAQLAAAAATAAAAPAAAPVGVPLEDASQARW